MGATLIISLINLIMGIIEILIGLRFILKFFRAGLAPFVSWVYETSQPLINPFVGIFPNPVITGGFVIEFSSLIALVVYTIIGYLLAEALATVSYNARRRTL